MKNKNLWIVCGIPGAGKSTWITNNKNFFSGSINVVSRDKIRFALLDEGEDYFSRENDVWINFINEAKKSLKEYDNTILDATHLSINSRKKIFNALKNNLENINIYAIVFCCDEEIAIARNANRTGRSFVPVSAIRRMACQFTIPTEEEGFDKIIKIGA